MIEPISDKGTRNKAYLVCDGCGQRKMVNCEYDRTSTGDSVPNEARAKNKMKSLGWAIVKNKMLCAGCDAKRKEENMTQVTKLEPKAQTEAREPTRAQRREIIAALESVYDVENERYTGGYTDRIVAEEIGAGVMPGWVAKIRDEAYGPAGGNEETVALMDQLAKFSSQVDVVVKDARKRMESDVATAIADYQGTVDKKMAELSAMRARLERVEQAHDMRMKG